MNAVLGVVIVELVYSRQARWGLGHGAAIATALCADAAGRLAIEFLRDDPAQALGALNPWQVLLLVPLAAGAAGLARLVMRRAAPPAPAGGPA